MKFFSRELPAITQEALRFIVVGAANFVLTFILFYSLFRISGLNYSMALLVSWAIGMLFTYTLNFAWVFMPEGSLRSKSRFGKYFVSQLVSIGLNVLTLHLIVQSTGLDAFYVQCALIPLIVVFNFTTAKFWSLRRKTQK